MNKSQHITILGVLLILIAILTYGYLKIVGLLLTIAGILVVVLGIIEKRDKNEKRKNISM